MKKLILLLAFVLPLAVWAQTPSPTPLPTVQVPCEQLALDPVFVPPTWLQTAILFIKDLPYVGPVLVEVGKWAGVLAALLTSLSIFLLGLLRAAQPLTKLSFVGPVLSKVLEYLAKAMPYVQYLSMFNVQKKSEEKKA